MQLHAYSSSADEKIVVGGYSYIDYEGRYDIAIARYDTNGSLYNSFGNFGTVTTNFDTGDPMYDPNKEQIL